MANNSLPQLIEEAIASYGDVSIADDKAEAYSDGFLAAIYAPRVRALHELKAQGFTHAEWKWNDELGKNCWHGAKAVSA